MAMEKRAPDDLQEAVAATLRRLRGELGPSPQPGMTRAPASAVAANQRVEPTLPLGGSEPAQPAQPDLLARAETGPEIPPNPSQRLAELRSQLARPDVSERRRPRLLPYALSAMAVILFAGIGWWTYSSVGKPRSGGQVPLVAADQTPDKVPPPADQVASEDIASSDKTIYNEVSPGSAPPPATEVLLPAPTVPDIPVTTAGGNGSATGASGTGTTTAATGNSGAATGQTVAAGSTTASATADAGAASAGGTAAATTAAGSTATGSTATSANDNAGATTQTAAAAQAPAAATTATTDTSSSTAAAQPGAASADTGGAGTASAGSAASGATGTGLTETLIPSAGSGTDEGSAATTTATDAGQSAAATGDTGNAAATTSATTGASTGIASGVQSLAVEPAVPAEVYDLSNAPASVPRLAPVSAPSAGNDASDAAAATAALQPLAPEPATIQTTTAEAAATQPAASAAAAPASTQVASLGGIRIQLAALKTEADAKAAWRRLSAAHGDLLGGLGYRIEKVALASGTYYRLQAGPFPDRAKAENVCVKLKAQGQQCLVKP